MKRIVIAIIALCTLSAGAADVLLGRASALQWSGTGAARLGTWWTPARLGPKAWYKADNNALDAMGVYPGAWVGTAAYAAGVNQQAFAGAAVVEIADAGATMFTNQALTVAAWIYPTGNPAVRNPAYPFGDRKTTTRAGSWQLEWGSGNGATQATIAVTGVGTFVAQTGSVAPVNQWTHVAYVRSGTLAVQQAVFINGQSVELITSANYTIDAASAENKQIRLSGYGRIDDILAFDRALTPAEITQIYNWRAP